MALPLTITGLSTAIPIVGPFKSSGGNFYCFGKDSSTATTLQAFKSTAPDTSWSSIATNTGFTTAVQWVAGFQVGDTIYLAVIDGATTSCNLKYRTFSMSSDTFGTSETVHSGFNPQTSGGVATYGCSIAFRSSDSQPIILYNGPQVASMGSSYSRIVYARRTGTNTWTTNVACDQGGAVNCYYPDAKLGTSSAVEFGWNRDTSPSFIFNKLSSANALSSVGGSNINTAAANTQVDIISYDQGGTQKFIISGTNSTPAINISYMDEAGLTNQGNGTAITGTKPERLFNDGSDAWILFRKSDGAVYVRKSTDALATSGSEATAHSSTTVAAADINLSIDGAVYQNGTRIVVPFFVNDNGTIKYNEYLIRTTAQNVAPSLFQSRATGSSPITKLSAGWSGGTNTDCSTLAGGCRKSTGSSTAARSAKAA